MTHHTTNPHRLPRHPSDSRRAGYWRLAVVRLPAVVAAGALVLAGCTLGGDSGQQTPADPEQANDGEANDGETNDSEANDGEATEPQDAQPGGPVQVITHDSFALSEELLESFTEQTGHELQFSAPGDGGALVNQLIITQDAPLGDVVYGVDNSFASRGIAEGVFDEYASPELPASAEQYLIDGGHALAPVDVGDVCLNIDTAWYDEQGITAPQDLADLTEDTYAEQLVVTNPATSSPGLAFLLATIAEFGEDWTDYWQDLSDNGLLVVDSWSTAYSEEFSGSVGEGPRPIALSYSTSPAFEVGPEGEDPETESMLDTCFRQVEYAGVISGAQNPEGAQDFIDFLLSDQVQADIPDQMFMYPVNDELDLPQEWTRWAPLADEPRNLEPAEIDQGRQEWIDTWTDIVIG